jgi:hypothetical protein
MKIKKEIKLLMLMIFTLFLMNLAVGSTVNNLTIQNFTSIDKSNWDYTDLELISVGMTMTSDVPDMVVDSQGNIHIVWLDYSNYFGSGTDGSIFYRNYNVITESWSGIYFISDESGAGIVSVNPAIDIDLQDNLHVVWGDTSSYGSSGADKDILYRCRNATTQLWQTTEVVSTESTATSYEADIVVDYDGNVSVVWSDATDYGGAGSVDTDIFFKQRLRATDTWTTTQVVSASSDSGSQDATLDIDSEGKVHVVWCSVENAYGAGPDWDLVYSIYDPSVDTWSSIELLTYFSGDYSRKSSIKIDEEDNVHLCWEEKEDIQGSGTEDIDIAYMRYIDSASTWGMVDIVSKESDLTSYSSETEHGLEIDSEGNVHITWYDQDYGNSSYNVMYRILYTDTNVWSKAELISMESTDFADYSLEPVLALDQADNVYFAWAEGKDGILGSGNDYDIVFRAYAGPPQTPFLQNIVPNPTESSSVTLLWQTVPGARSYKVYRGDLYIYNVDSMTELDSTSNSFYIDTLSAEDIYYYVVVAENRFGLSYISNCVVVEYRPPALSEQFIGFMLWLITLAVTIPVIYIKSKKKK